MIITRRTALLLSILVCTPAIAVEDQFGPAFSQPYSADALAAAQKADRTVLIEIAARWCATCRQQRHVLEQLHTEQRFWNVVVLVVDYDAHKDIVRKSGATMQGTLIVYKGTQERGRLVMDANAARIARLLQSAL